MQSARHERHEDELTRPNLTVGLLRECFRNLESFRALFEDTQIEVLTGPDGIEVCLWDLLYLYDNLRDRLPKRQWQAIEWFLVEGLKEEEVAERMGIAPSNPVGMYATAGLNSLIRMIDAGEFDRFGPERPFVVYREKYIAA